MLCDPNTHSISTPHGPISQEWVQEVELVPVEAHHVDEVEVLEVVVVEVAAHHDLRGQDLTAHA